MVDIESYEQDILPLIGNTEIMDERLGAMNEQLTDLIDQIEKLILDNAHHAKAQDDYANKFRELNDAIESKRSDIDSIKYQISDALARRENAKIFIEGLKNQKSYVEEFDVSGWHALVDYIKVMPDKRIVFHLRNGCEEAIRLEEVQQ